MIETLRKEVGDLPIVAIGGISLDNVQEVAKHQQMVFLLSQRLQEALMLQKLCTNSYNILNS